MEDLSIASAAQYEEIRHLKRPSSPIQYSAPLSDPQQLKKEVQNLAFCPPESRTRRFKEIVSTQYEIHPVVGDGRCGLRAIVREINPELFRQRQDELEGQLADTLRQSVVDHMAKHRSTYEAFCRTNPLNRNRDVASFEEYLELIGRTRAYIDQQELEAASSQIRRPIWVFNINALEIDEHDQIIPNRNYRYGTDFEGEPVCLIRIGDHFDLLKKRRTT